MPNEEQPVQNDSLFKLVGSLGTRRRSSREVRADELQVIDKLRMIDKLIDKLRIAAFRS